MSDTDKFRKQGAEAELRIAQQLGGHVRVKDVGKRKGEIAAQTENVVAGCVEDLLHSGVGHYRGQGREIAQRQRVEHESQIVRGDLNQADLLEIVVEAVSFDIDRDALSRPERIEHELKRGGSVYPCVRRRG